MIGPQYWNIMPRNAGRLLYAVNSLVPGDDERKLFRLCQGSLEEGFDSRILVLLVEMSSP